MGRGTVLRDVLNDVLRGRSAGAALDEIYSLVEEKRPSTSPDAIRGELNHGVRAGRYVRLAPALYGLAPEADADQRGGVPSD